MSFRMGPGVRIRKARLRGGRGVPSNPLLEKLGQEMSQVVRVDMTGALEKWSGRTNYDVVADAVYSGEWRKVLAKLPMRELPQDLKDGLAGLRASMTKASRISAKDLHQVARENAVNPNSLSLTSSNPFVDEYLDTRVGMLVENVNENLQVNIQRAVRAGIDGNKPAVEVAKQIKAGLPLNSRQETALANYRTSVEGAGMTPKQVERAVNAYQKRLVDQRAMAIARTEVSYAQNESQLEVWRNAQAQGLLGDKLMKVWVVDGDPCLICQDLSGTAVALDENFVTAVGDELPSPPAHPNCMCSLAVQNGGKTSDD